MQDGSGSPSTTKALNGVSDHRDLCGACPHFEDDAISARTCSICNAPKATTRARVLNSSQNGPLVVGDGSVHPRIWLYENWVHDRVRIHRADCVFCNDGAG